MMKAAFAVLAGGLIAAAPLQAQTHGEHRHGRQSAQPEQPAQHAQHAQHEGGEHCPMHAAKHGAGEGASHAHGAGHGAAQGAAHGAGHHGAAAGGGMMAAHRTAPRMLLQHRQMLELTDAQVAQLEALQAEHAADCERRMAAARAADEAAAAAVAGATPDLAAYEARLREAASHRVDCRVDMARISAVGAALLTDAQRAHLPHLGHGSH